MISLKSGGNWYDLKIVSQNEEDNYAGIENGQIALNQDLSQAEEGGSVDVVVEGLFAYLDEKRPLVFEIERGVYRRHTGGDPAGRKKYSYTPHHADMGWN